jgi:putative nucleotidyltransferase with HDIG domain
MRFWTKYKLKKQGVAGKKLRKNVEQGRLYKVLERSRFIRGIIGVSTCVGVIVIILLGNAPYREKMDLYVGQPAPDDVFADISFKFENGEETEKLRREAEAKVLPRYSFSPERLNECARIIDEIFMSVGKEGGETASVASVAPVGQEGLERLISIADLDPHNVEILREADEPAKLQKEMLSFVAYLAGPGAPSMEEVGQEAQRISTAQNGDRYRSALLSVARDKTKKWATDAIPRDRRLREAAMETLNYFFRRSADYDEALTAMVKKEKGSQIKPVISVVQPGSKIIEKGYEITPQQMEVYSAYLTKREELHPPFMRMQKRLYHVLGLSLLIVLFLIISRRYLRRYQSELYQSNSAMFMLELIFLGALFLSRGVTLIPFGMIQSDWNNIFYYFIVISVPMAAILVTVLLNRTLALYFVVILGIFIGIMKGLSFSYMMVSFAGGVVAVYSTVGVRRRSQLVKAGAAVAIANMICIGAIDAISDISVSSTTVGYRITGGLICGMVSAFLAAGFLPLFEYVFNVVTDISLLELSDLNHPLLKRMFIEAPGTYHHSLMVGNLAEAAAAAVGANPLQVRVCAYFHDIGKLKKPEYFTENEMYGKSKHDELNPRMSGLIIISHVKDGIDMAVKQKLNRKIIDAIREHHGSGLVFFFYRRAEEARAKGEQVSQEDYRYPGPKPQSKESAILLLADAVEAASRSLTRPTPSRIKNLVREIINLRIMDGQLDECDLTFRDLHKIAERFEHILHGTFHTRVKYPERGETPEVVKSPDESAAEKSDQENEN